MIWNTFEDNKKVLKMQYNNSNWNAESGLPAELLKEECLKIEKEMINEPKIKTKAKIMEYILKNAQIEVLPFDWFADKINHGDIMAGFQYKWQDEINRTAMFDSLEKNKDAAECLAYTADVDYGHTAPDWDIVMELGIPGILRRVQNERQNKELTQEQILFYDSCEIVYTAIINYILRLSHEAKRLETENEKMIIVSQCLQNLATGAPKTLLEAMQLTFIYYFVHHHIDCENLRSLGGLDRLYYRFYKSDIESGRYTEDQIRELIKYFLYKFCAKNFTANIPFFLCGIDKNGNDATNELTYIILEEYIKMDIYDPKIHIRYHKNISERILKIVLDSIRNGKNSFVFMNDDVVINALKNIGESEEDARNYTPIGCYEPASMGKEVPCTCNGRINIPKAIEAVIYNGKYPLTDKKIGIESNANDMKNYEDFYSVVKNQLKFFIEQVRQQVSEYERYYMEVNPSPIFSATLTECVLQGKDAYAGGAKYNNSSITAFGIATAVDSLIAIKKAVFEEKIVTLNEFAEALKKNWNGYEWLQRRCKNDYPKYGNNNNEADEIMTDLSEFIASKINNYPNGRGGVFRCGMFSIDWRIYFGEKTGATPDGRMAHEMLSKNMCASIAQDKAGVTALINSVTKIDYTKIPDGTVLDMTLHSSATQGDDGLLAMIGLIKTYMKRGGLAIHCNVLDSKMLRKAQANPQDYSTLQVRLCGWNVYFINLSEKEQNDFIKQAEHIEV